MNGVTGGARTSAPSWALAVAAAVCLAAAGVGGYVVGHSGGADVHGARVSGERAGRERAAADRSGYAAAVGKGRKEGYAKAYRAAYRKASRRPGQ